MRQGDLEIEVKVALRDVRQARVALIRAGAKPLGRGRAFEDNILFDSAGRDLAARRSILRLRSVNGKACLTHKQPPPSGRVKEIAARMKVLQEVECTVGSLDQMATILQRLGFEQVYRYQKYREELTLGGITIMLDETPIGSFLELEGSAERIRRVAQNLGYGEECLLVQSYRALHAEYCRGMGVPFGDMVFARRDRR